MAANEVIYTDGQRIIVTPSAFQVKDVKYNLLGITKHGLAVMKPIRLPGIALITLGIAVSLVGFFRLVPSGMIQNINIHVYGKLVSANNMALAMGLLFMTLGLIILIIVKEKYAVRIATAEGETNAVVSNQREYINQIINALNRAFMMESSKKALHK